MMLAPETKFIIKNLLGVLGALLVVMSAPKLLFTYWEHVRVGATGWPRFNVVYVMALLTGCLVCTVALRWLKRE